MRQVCGSIVVVLGLCGAGAQAQETGQASLFGMPGAVTMPAARDFDPGELGATYAFDEGTQRYTLSFQITPRLVAAFRYSIIDDFAGTLPQNFDRSFDLQYRLLDEGRYTPALAVGLRDFIGTGVFSGEYLVASKQIIPTVTGSVGIGWGVLGQRDSFTNPLLRFDDRFDTREGFTGLGGEANSTSWFRGDAAAFAGVTWQVTDRLGLALDYASDTQDLAVAGLQDPTTSPVNLGLSYVWRPGVTIGAQYLQGETLSATARFALNPANPPAGGDLSPAPIPYARRDAPNRWAGPVVQDAIPPAARIDALAAGLAGEGIRLRGIAEGETAVVVRIDNTRFDAQPQAIGRTARLLALIMPASVETFAIETVVNGVPVSRVTLQRSELEAAEFTPDVVARSLAAAQIGPAVPVPGLQPRAGSAFRFGLGPFLGLGLFDPDDPLRADVGLELSASYHFVPQLALSGAVRSKLFGNRDQSTRQSDSVLPRVRSDQARYDRDGTVWMERLTLDHFGRIGSDLYTRASVGYFEEMFGGVSGEILWKPADSRLALGAELNYAMQRDTDKLFGFDDFDYSVTSGHLSGYYAFANGFDVQLDVGRYLAGDWGTTISLDRRFGNGWSVGAFATLTDVPFEDFGEGSFDKGLRFSVPLSFALGQPIRETANLTLRPIQRDGGARLNIGNRLYPAIRDAHAPELADQWGRFWR